MSWEPFRGHGLVKLERQRLAHDKPRAPPAPATAGGNGQVQLDSISNVQPTLLAKSCTLRTISRARPSRRSSG